MRTLSGKIVFYICIGELATHNGLRTDSVTREFEEITPGFTTIEAVGGYYRNPREYTNIVTHLIERDDQDDIESVRECLYKLQSIQAEFEQESMQVELNGIVYWLQNQDDYIELFNRYIAECHPVLVHYVQGGEATWPGY